MIEPRTSDFPLELALANQVDNPRFTVTEAEIQALFARLRSEMQSKKADVVLVATRAEIYRALNKYLAADRIVKTSQELDTISKEVPDSEEARKAAVAIDVFKSDEPVPPSITTYQSAAPNVERVKATFSDGKQPLWSNSDLSLFAIAERDGRKTWRGDCIVSQEAPIEFGMQFRFSTTDGRNGYILFKSKHADKSGTMIVKFAGVG